jgi:hypothetical protein
MWTPIARPGRPLPESKALPTCPVCNERVKLETSKTDEHGHAIHEECYVSTLQRALANTPPEPE